MTSVATTSAAPDPSPNEAAVSLSAAARRPASTTVKPAFDSATATPRPMPLPAPVTTATLRASAIEDAPDQRVGTGFSPR